MKFLQGCSTPSPYISVLPPVSPHKLPNPPVDSHKSLRELGFRVCKGVLSPEEASQWYTIVTASLKQVPAQRDAAWDLVSNEHSRECCWAFPVRMNCNPGCPKLVLMRRGARSILCFSVALPPMRRIPWPPCLWNPGTLRASHSHFGSASTIPCVHSPCYFSSMGHHLTVPFELRRA